MEDTAALDANSALDELLQALKQMKKDKSPGLDGIPPEFDLRFWQDLGPLLLEMFHTALQKEDVNTAIITNLVEIPHSH